MFYTGQILDFNTTEISIPGYCTEISKPKFFRVSAYASDHFLPLYYYFFT